MRRPIRKSLFRSRLVALFVLCAACAPDPAAERAARGSVDFGLMTDVEHGRVWFGARVESALSANASRHSFTFALQGQANVRLATTGTDADPDVDTFLALYRKGARGYGKPIARNDNHGGTVFSAITRTLPRGEYRVVVSGRTRKDVGPFLLSAGCNGPGCPTTPAAPTCLFGREIFDIAQHVPISAVRAIGSPAELPSDLARAQLLRSAQHTPSGDIQSLEGLFASVDGGTVRWFRIRDSVGARQFVGYEYALLGESYGGIFPAEACKPVAEIDGDALTRCRVRPERCVFGTTFHELRDSPDFEIIEKHVVTQRSMFELTEIGRSQLLHAVQVAYEEAGTVDEALASVDQNEVNRIVFEQPASGRRYVAYEYGAGDNSYGAVFGEHASTILARIEDGDLYGCAVLVAR